MDRVEINAKILALECGALSLRELIDWADDSIIKADAPDTRLFDVAVAKDINEAVRALQRFGLAKDSEAVAKRAFTLFIHALDSDEVSYELVAQKLNQMVFAVPAVIPNSEAVYEMTTFFDDLDIANDGIYGDPNKIKRAMMAFLKQHSSFSRL